jgi:hypothetical protein
LLAAQVQYRLPFVTARRGAHADEGFAIEQIFHGLQRGEKKFSPRARGQFPAFSDADSLAKPRRASEALTASLATLQSASRVTSKRFAATQRRDPQAAFHGRHERPHTSEPVRTSG